jgi:3-oxoacyl-[acyl-carrier-protein] synthase III
VLSYDKLTKDIVRIKIVSSSGVLAGRKISENDILEICKSLVSNSKELFHLTGVEFRRYANELQATSDLATICLLPMLESSIRDKIKCLILSTTSPDFTSPATAHIVHSNLKLLSSTFSFDVGSSCTSFLSGFLAAMGILGPQDKYVAVCASEVKNKSLGQDIRMRSLFSDGAAGMILKVEDTCDSNVGFVHCHTSVRSDLVSNIQIPVGGSREPVNSENFHRARLHMTEPRMIFRETVKEMVLAIESCWQKRGELGISEDAPGIIFVHQANANILHEVKQRLPSNISDRIPVLMRDVGNTVCASLPLLRVRWKMLECLFEEGTDFQLPQKYLEQTGGQHFVCGDGEKIYWNDPLENFNRWFLNDYSEEEKKEIHDCIASFAQPQSSKKRADCWVAAGGGFQTIGLLQLY